jgi:hypothetical protein
MDIGSALAIAAVAVGAVNATLSIIEKAYSYRSVLLKKSPPTTTHGLLKKNLKAVSL